MGGYVGNGPVVPVGKDGFPSGTRMLFQQAAAPIGWVKETSLNDYALRVVSGTPSTGGSIDFSALFGRTATDAFTLTASHIPGHTHSFSATSGTQSANHTHAVSGSTASGGAHTHQPHRAGDAFINGVVDGSGSNGVAAGSNVTWQNQTGSSGAHTHTMSFTSGSNSVSHTHSVSGTTGSTGSGGGHSHAIDMRIKYVDVILAVKA